MRLALLAILMVPLHAAAQSTYSTDAERARQDLNDYGARMLQTDPYYPLKIQAVLPVVQALMPDFPPSRWLSLTDRVYRAIPESAFIAGIDTVPQPRNISPKCRAVHDAIARLVDAANDVRYCALTKGYVDDCARSARDVADASGSLSSALDDADDMRCQ